jgi:hypothetical protein
MADTTTVMALPFPEGADANDVPADMQALAERLDEAPGIESLTSAEISALTAGQKPAGRVVYNSTTSKLQISNGTSFADVDAAALASAALKLPLAGGTMSGAIAMGGSKVTGLAAGDAAGDAVRYEQLTALGVWSAWTPSLTASSSNPTSSNVTAESRYMQIGKTVIGKGQVTVTANGSGDYRFSLPVTPTSTAAYARRMGFLQISNGNFVHHFSLEQVNGQTYCRGVNIADGPTVPDLLGSPVMSTIAGLGGGNTTVTWDFQYEAA